MVEVGKIIKKLRKEKKLTLVDLANDKMSPAMISMIENGKSQPSINTLKYIAKQLDVETSVLLGELPKEELRKLINKYEQILNQWKHKEDINNALTKIESILPSLTNDYESARIYELYVRFMIIYYQFFKEDFNDLRNNNWELYTNKALHIYSELQIENRTLKMKFLIAQIEHLNANYQKAMQLIEDCLKIVKDQYTVENIPTIINLMILRVHNYTAIGDFKSSLNYLQEAIKFSKDSFMLYKFFDLNNLGALISYNENMEDEAKEYIKSIEQYYNLVKNPEVYIDKQLALSHYTEFFENKPKHALEMINELETSSLVERDFYEQEINFIKDQKARCYTKLNRPEKAIEIFNELDYWNPENYHPIDFAVQQIYHTYKAICYLKLDDYDKALQSATQSVNKLRGYPHTKYYHYSKQVLDEIQKSK